MIFRTLTVFVFFISSILSCGKDDINALNTPKTILEFANATPGLSIFTQAVNKTDVNVLLQDNNVALTVFAPSNVAFKTYFETNNFSSINDVPIGQLKQLLLYNMVNKVLLQEDLTTGAVNTLAKQNDNCLSLLIQVNDTAITLNNDASVDITDFKAINGVMHIVNKITPIPTL